MICAINWKNIYTCDTLDDSSPVTTLASPQKLNPCCNSPDPVELGTSTRHRTESNQVFSRSTVCRRCASGGSASFLVRKVEVSLAPAIEMAPPSLPSSNQDIDTFLTDYQSATEMAANMDTQPSDSTGTPDSFQSTFRDRAVCNQPCPFQIQSFHIEASMVPSLVQSVYVYVQISSGSIP